MPGPLTLAIEISNPSAAERGDREQGFGAGVALGDDSGAVIGKELLRESQRHDDDLMPAVDRLFSRAGAGARELGRVAVSVGPGGYTALRIAVATAKMLCEATGAECIAVPTALVVARRVESPRPFAVALASKGESAWVTVLNGDADGTRGRLITGAEAGTLGVPLLVADRFLPEAVREAALRAEVRIERPRFDAVACLEAARDLPAIDPVALAPLYPREAEAVTQWRKRHGG